VIRLWCNRFGPKYAARLKRKHRGYGNTLFIDEVFIRIDGKQQYLWRAFNQESLPREKRVLRLKRLLLVGMVKLSICFFKNDETVRQQSDSLKDF